jgi:hypothetical protein
MNAYREVIDADRRAYAESLESDVGRWFEGAVEQIAQDFVDAVTRKPASRPASSPRPRERGAPPALPDRASPARR